MRGMALYIGLIFILIQLILAESMILLENRYPEKTRRWLTVLGALPVAGFLLYLIMGFSARRGRLFPDKHLQGARLRQAADRQKRKLSMNKTMPDEEQYAPKRLTRLILTNASAPLTANNQITVLTNGQNKFRVLKQELEQAVQHIHLEYYIYRNDVIGREIQDILIRKRRQGVEVRFLVDGAGSKGLPQSFYQDMEQAGIETDVFFPVRFPYLGSRLNYRNHRKIVIIDGKTAFTGGMNVGDEYVNRDRSLGLWRDTHLMIKGEAVAMLQTAFLNDWSFCTNRKVQGAQYYPQPEPVGHHLTQIIAGGPDAYWDSVKQALFKGMTGAHQRIHITTPYLIPDESMVTLLQTMALSGVEVKLLVQGIPDHRFVQLASQSYFQELLEAGVQIYTYQKGILHAKIVTVDEDIAFVGTANFDIRSFKLDLEVTAAIYNRGIVQRLEQDFTHDLHESERVKLAQFKERGLAQRMMEAHARLMAPLL